MDVLDLSVGEKRTSRRKAHAPQRRQAKEDDESEKKEDSADEGEELIQHPKEGDEGASEEQRTICLETTPRTRSRLAKQQKYSINPDLTVSHPFSNNRPIVEPNNNVVLSPYSNNSNEDSTRCAEESRTPSPSVLMSSSGSSSGKLSTSSQGINSYLANMNSNNSNIVLDRGGTTVGNLPENSSQSSPHISPFQERYPNLSASLPQLLMGAAMKNAASSTYGSFDVQPLDTPGIPERTKKQNRWAFNVWREWARKRNLSCVVASGQFGKVPLDVGKATEEELDFWLAKFVKEIRRKDGNPYPPHTLMQIVMGIQRYLRQQAGRPSICILDRSNPVYSRFRSVLDVRIKELTSNGVSSTQKSGRRTSLPSNSASLSNSFSNYPEQSVLWSAGIIGNDTALGLLNAVFYHNTVTFGIRNIDDHWNLKMSHFVLGNRGQQSQSYIEFVPSRDPSYVNRGMSKDCRVYADPNNPRCVVKLFQKYMSLIPPDGAFYRHPQEPTLVDRSIRFSDQWVGKNRLRAMIKHVFDSTRLDGKDRLQSTPSTSPSLSLKQPTDNLTNPASNPAEFLPGMPNVYERLAQVFMQFSSMRSSPQLNPGPDFGSSSMNSSPAPSVDTYKSSPRQSTKEDHIVLKREYSPDNISDIIESKKLRLSAEDSSPKPLHVNDDVDDIKVTSSCEKDPEDNKLEIAVPRSVSAVIIVKGSRRYKLQLDD